MPDKQFAFSVENGFMVDCVFSLAKRCDAKKYIYRYRRETNSLAAAHKAAADGVWDFGAAGNV